MNHAPAPDGLFTDTAVQLLERLHRELDGERRRLLAARRERGPVGFSAATREIREGEWTVSPPPPALADRRVEITGPTNAKMVINALNCGARCFMADFEDANSPTWRNMTDGQVNLAAAVRGTLAFEDRRLNEDRALLLVRPRGLHLPERHATVDDQPMAGAFFDFGVFAAHNARELLERGAGPFLYLPKLESHLEARLWRDAFLIAEEMLGLDRGTIRATVLIETVPAAFEMDEILYELRQHSAGLNAGRWDYLFSMIKIHRDDPAFVLPDRNTVTMTVPFMRAYTERLVQVCHRRGAHAMGGMAAVIPSRRDPEASEQALQAVAADKRREAEAGYDGTWVAHPDSVDTAMAEFDRVLQDRPNQIDRRRDDVEVGAEDLLDVAATPGEITHEGLQNDVDVAIRYIASWLGGNGAAAINGLMEDAATAEIARAQVWQWTRHGHFTRDDARAQIDPEHDAAARALFERVALEDDLPEFLTLEGLVELESRHSAAQ